MRLIKVAAGIHWVEIPEADLRILCGCPADTVKHLAKRGLVVDTLVDRVACETGPNAILLSEIALQKGEFCNLAEFPILQMLYRQGLAIPDHPKNQGIKPMLIGLEKPLAAQLAYIFRGNYGLISESEMEAAGVPPDTARDWMRIKRRFAFGDIKAPDDLVDRIVITDGRVALRGGATIERLALNVYAIRCGVEEIVVDLNLGQEEAYESPYPLNYHNLRREYFAIVHSGEGDGWDVNRPCMSSVLMFQGKIFLIDAGPNLHAILKSLGIGINEVEGIFQTHCHDDHFSGLTTLMRADRRIRYFATQAVRASVTKKFAALVSIEESEFEAYFEICDLELGRWNEIEGLEVCPIHSPHPVETNVLRFRVLTEDGYKIYAHLADIISLENLTSMTNDNPDEPGISSEIAAQVRRDYLEPADIKKIDIGGGLIHGAAEDFVLDVSRKIVLAHTANALTDAERAIGSGAPFGTIDVLAPSARDYSRAKADEYLRAYFPDVGQHELEMLLNRPVQDFNPETILYRVGERCESVAMPLSGLVEVIGGDPVSRYLLSAGTLIGEIPCLDNIPAAKTYRAASFVKAFVWPASLYRAFIARNDLSEATHAAYDMRGIFVRSWLLAENLSLRILNRLVRAALILNLPAGATIDESEDLLFLVSSGIVERHVGETIVDRMGVSDFFGEATVLSGKSASGRAIVAADCELIALPGSLLREIPIVRWKLFETEARRRSQWSR